MVEDKQGDERTDPLACAGVMCGLLLAALYSLSPNVRAAVAWVFG